MCESKLLEGGAHLFTVWWFVFGGCFVFMVSGGIGSELSACLGDEGVDNGLVVCGTSFIFIFYLWLQCVYCLVEVEFVV